MNNIYSINAEGQIEQVNYKELVWKFVDITTTQRGVAPRFHVREEVWFRVEGNWFEKKAEAEVVAESNTIEEVTRFEGWTCGHQGHFPKLIQVFDTQEESDEWLFKGAEMDFQNDCDAPLIFNTQAEAEEWVKENTSDQEPS